MDTMISNYRKQKMTDICISVIDKTTAPLVGPDLKNHIHEGTNAVARPLDFGSSTRQSVLSGTKVDKNSIISKLIKLKKETNNLDNSSFLFKIGECFPTELKKEKDNGRIFLSKYEPICIETEDKIIIIRVSDHNVNCDNVEKYGYSDGKGVTIKPKNSPNTFKANDNVNFKEYVFFATNNNEHKYNKIIDGLVFLFKNGEWNEKVEYDAINISPIIQLTTDNSSDNQNNAEDNKPQSENSSDNNTEENESLSGLSSYVDPWGMNSVSYLKTWIRKHPEFGFKNDCKAAEQRIKNIKDYGSKDYQDRHYKNNNVEIWDCIDYDQTIKYSKWSSKTEHLTFYISDIFQEDKIWFVEVARIESYGGNWHRDKIELKPFVDSIKGKVKITKHNFLQKIFLRQKQALNGLEMNDNDTLGAISTLESYDDIFLRNYKANNTTFDGDIDNKLSDEELLKKYSWLPKNSKKGKMYTADVSKNVKTFLSYYFPDVKFSVRKDRYSNIWIDYEEDVCPYLIDIAINKFNGGTWNGMAETYEYHTTNFKKLFTNEYSPINTYHRISINDNILLDCAKKNDFSPLLKKYPLFFPTKDKDIFDFLCKNLRLATLSGNMAYSDLKYIDLRPKDNYKHGKINTPKPTPQPTTNVEIVNIPNSKFTIIDYSENSVVLIGDTKPYADKLGRNGIKGVFNYNLKPDKVPGKQGWIFSKNKLQEVNEFVAKYGKNETAKDEKYLHKLFIELVSKAKPTISEVKVGDFISTLGSFSYHFQVVAVLEDRYYVGAICEERKSEYGYTQVLVPYFVIKGTEKKCDFDNWDEDYFGPMQPKPKFKLGDLVEGWRGSYTNTIGYITAVRYNTIADIYFYTVNGKGLNPTFEYEEKELSHWESHKGGFIQDYVYAPKFPKELSADFYENIWKDKNNSISLQGIPKEHIQTIPPFQIGDILKAKGEMYDGTLYKVNYVGKNSITTEIVGDYWRTEFPWFDDQINNLEKAKLQHLFVSWNIL